MKLAILFVISLYIGLPSIVLLPILIGNSVLSIALVWLCLILIFLAAAAFIYISGILSCVKVANSDVKSAVKMWRIMKLATVPIYVANFLFITTFGMVMFPATVIIGFASAFLCCSAIVLSGITGTAAIRKSASENENISMIHYVLQFIPVLDVTDTLILLRKI